VHTATQLRSRLHELLMPACKAFFGRPRCGLWQNTVIAPEEHICSCKRGGDETSALVEIGLADLARCFSLVLNSLPKPVLFLLLGNSAPLATSRPVLKLPALRRVVILDLR
jgi:hypothetical protein